MTEQRYLRPTLLEAIARNTLKRYNPDLVTGLEIRPIPIEDIIEFLGLSLEFQYIRKSGKILGETIFDDDYVPIYDMVKKEYSLVFMERGTIIIDAGLSKNRQDGRLRFTAAHELAHWLIHQELYCGTDDIAAMSSYAAKSSGVDKQIERQADMLAGALLMPINQVKRAFYRTVGTNKVLILAEQFGVSVQAMEIRLKEHRML